MPDEHDQALANEQRLVETQDVQYRYIPVVFSAPTSEDFHKFCGYMNEFKNSKIHIHCAANYRATAFYALYAHKYLRWTKQECYELIQSVWSPDEYPVWQEFLVKNGL